jgi:acyl carrier protein
MVPRHAVWPLKDNDEERKELRTQVEEWLTNWFVARTKITRSPPETLRDIDYFEAGWLTSMEVVEFVTEIEQRFGIQFSDRDLQDPRFVTIAGLTELILQRSTETSKSR